MKDLRNLALFQSFPCIKRTNCGIREYDKMPSVNPVMGLKTYVRTSTINNSGI